MNSALDLDVVALATDQAPHLEVLARRLHRRLCALSSTWRLTLVDHASSDATAAEAERVARGLGASFEKLPTRLTRAALHERWLSSPAATVVFLELTPDLDVDDALTPLAQRSEVSRRAVLAGIGGLGLTGLLAACSRSDSGLASPTSASRSTAATATSATTGGVVVTVPEMTEGPYYLDLDLVREDIREDRDGAALTLEFTIVATATGEAIPGAAVDLWHCDAEGLYSGFVAESEGEPGGGNDDSTFLRGTQVAGDDGRVRFTTIYPGWYRGRAVHMHMKVHTDGSTATSQLFFVDDFTDRVYASTEPYASRGERDRRNDDDNIYGNGGTLMTLTVNPSGDGYIATPLALAVSS